MKTKAIKIEIEATEEVVNELMTTVNALATKEGTVELSMTLRHVGSRPDDR